MVKLVLLFQTKRSLHPINQSHHQSSDQALRCLWSDRLLWSSPNNRIIILPSLERVSFLSFFWKSFMFAGYFLFCNEIGFERCVPSRRLSLLENDAFFKFPVYSVVACGTKLVWDRNSSGGCVRCFHTSISIITVEVKPEQGRWQYFDRCSSTVVLLNTRDLGETRWLGAHHWEPVCVTFLWGYRFLVTKESLKIAGVVERLRNKCRCWITVPRKHVPSHDTMHSLRICFVVPTLLFVSSKNPGIHHCLLPASTVWAFESACTFVKCCWANYAWRCLAAGVQDHRQRGERAFVAVLNAVCRKCTRHTARENITRRRRHHFLTPVGFAFRSVWQQSAPVRISRIA